MYSILSIVDIIVPFFLVVVIFFVSKYIQNNKIVDNPSYKYYVSGLMVKLFGGIAVCLVYIFYYGGGDTINYYNDARCVVGVFLSNPINGINILLHGINSVTWSYFDYDTWWPVYVNDLQAFTVVRIAWLFVLVTFKSYIGTTMLLAWISFFPIWRMYQIFIIEFPKLQRQFAIAILFIPSVFFWGSGLLKDTVTFSAVALFTSSLYLVLVMKERILLNVIYLIIASFILISIKPYILFALLPGSVLWLSGIFLSSVENPLLRKYLVPVLSSVAVVSVIFGLRMLGGSLGDYSVDKVLNKAVVTQSDLKSEHYQGSSFDIGEFDPTIQGVLSKAPVAINAALFRPYLWESNNIAMLISGIENLILLLATIYLIIKLRVFNLFRLILQHRMLFFTVTFSLFFSFSVGLTTSNFGSLVRYKIPAIPFYLASLFIIKYLYDKENLENEESEVGEVTG
jgi:hypothetical protein